MSIQTNTHAIDGAREFVLLMAEKDSNQRTLCQYGVNGAILTTDYDSLLIYAQNLTLHFGRDRTYTIASLKTQMMLTEQKQG